MSLRNVEQNIFKSLKNIVVDQLAVQEEQVTLKANFAIDLRADFLDIVELVMAIEKEFGIEIPDQDAEKCLH